MHVEGLRDLADGLSLFDQSLRQFGLLWTELTRATWKRAPLDFAASATGLRLFPD